jgi:FMN-dependent NADH-azoreductase
MHNQPHSNEEKRAWEKVVAVIEGFKSADKYVTAVPMQSFSILYWLNIIVQLGQTFVVDSASNYKGLVTGKPTLIVYAHVGEYIAGMPTEGFDLQSKSVELILRFIGFTGIRSIIVEPTSARGPAVAE